MKNIMTGSREGIASAKETVGEMVEIFTGDSDAIVHLINIKKKHEDITIVKSIHSEELPETVRHYLSATSHVTYFMEKGSPAGG